MEPRLHRRVQRYGWDLAVQDYDRYWVPVLRACSERAVAMAGLRPGERVLDVATGTGVAAFMALEAVGPDGEVVATDISENMVRAVLAEAEGRKLSNLRGERVDAEDLAFPDGSFDAVLCVLGLMYPAEPQRAIDQMYRVLKPGGRAAVCVWGRRDRCGWAEIFPIVDARVNSDVCPLFFALGGDGALAYAFRQSGFGGLREERVNRPLVFKGDHELCAAAFAGGPVSLAYSKFTPEVRAEVHAEFIESVAAYRRNGVYQIPGEFAFLVGEKE